MLIFTHIQLFVETIFENSYLFTEKSDFATQIVRFEVNFILNIAIFPIFQENLIECPEFFGVFCIKMLKLYDFFLAKILSIRGLHMNF